jgi:hypothetical protein
MSIKVGGYGGRVCALLVDALVVNTLNANRKQRSTLLSILLCPRLVFSSLGLALQAWAQQRDSNNIRLMTG